MPPGQGELRRDEGVNAEEVVMKKLATIAAAALILTGSAGAVNAQYWRGPGWGHYGGYRYGWGGGGGAVAAGLIGGAILGTLITAAAAPPAYGYGYAYPP